MKIKIETITKTETEKEIYFPYYSTDGKYYYHIHSEKDTTRVSVSDDNTSAWICRVDTKSLTEEAAGYEATSEDIFQQVYCKALNIITGVDIKELAESIKHYATNDGITTTASHITPEFTSLLNTLTTK